MSHIVTIKTEVRDRVAVDPACRRLELPEPVEGEAKVFTTWTKGTHRRSSYGVERILASIAGLIPIPLNSRRTS
jgi:hypothetical protein